MWAHTRAHPSAFLTTRHVAPRIFPFPLGKTNEGAAVKEELWWEGGNPPHVVRHDLVLGVMTCTSAVEDTSES